MSTRTELLNQLHAMGVTKVLGDGGGLVDQADTVALQEAVDGKRTVIVPQAVRTTDQETECGCQPSNGFTCQHHRQDPENW